MKKHFLLNLLIFTLIATAATAQRSRKRTILTESTSTVKFIPTKIFRGGIIFGFEQAVGDRSSIEITAGPTVSNVSPFSVNGHGIFDQQDGLGNSTGSMMGMHVGAGFRYYPIEEKFVMNGFYVSPEISFTRHNYLFRHNIGNGVEETGYKQETAFGFIFGTQSWLSKTFGLDMYMGAGLKTINYLTYFSDYDYITFEPSWVSQTENRASWFLTMGVKVGIGMTPKK